MIVLITGDFCTGKDLTADMLVQQSHLIHDCEKFKKIQSYTTRKPRYEGERTHTFCTVEQYKDFLEKGQIIAETKINDNYYFTIKSQFDDKKINLYVIDDKGIKDVVESDIDDVYIIEVIRPVWLRDCPEGRLNRDRQSEPYKFTSDYRIINDGDIEKLKASVLACFNNIIKVKKSL